MSEEVITIWEAYLAPINAALFQYVTTEQLQALHDAAHKRDDTPPVVLEIIQKYVELRGLLDQL